MITKRLLTTTAFALAVLCGGAVPTSAATFFSNDTGLNSPTTTLTFDEVPLADGTAVTNQYSAYGVSFSNLWTNGFYDFTDAPALSSFRFGCPCFDAAITFAAPINSASFRLATNPGTTTIQAYLGGVLVASGLANTNTVAPLSFFGFTGGGFDSIRITNAPQNQALVIDDLQINGSLVGAVPEPATWAMMLLGFGAIGASMRRRRRVKAIAQLI